MLLIHTMKTKHFILPCIIGVAGCSSSGEQKVIKPNVIIVLLDDSGYGDWGCYGNALHRTPVIDQMAQEGTRFTSFYVSAGVSTPSRASLMTGCYPRRISMHINADPKPLMADGRQVLFPASHKGLNTSEMTIAEMLKEQDYATACIGKWHLGDQLPFLPTRRGFDYYYGIPYSNDMHRENFCPLPLMEQEEVIVAPVGQDSLTLRYTAKAIEFIKKNKSKPFFLYLAHAMTHNPLAASPAFKGKSKNGLYGDAIEELDWSMGELFALLRKEGIDEKTLVIFCSDNGATHQFGGSNYPLRGWKGTTDEGGQRVPCIIRWPGIIPAGRVCDEVVTAMDFFPTIAHYCKGNVPTDRIIDGKNIAPLLEGKPGAKSQTEVFYYYQRQQLQAVRWGKWKYHLPLEQKIIRKTNVAPSQAELYDLDKDISESNNLVEQHPEIVTQMEIFIRNVRDDIGDWGYEGKNQRPAGIIDEPFPRLMRQ